MEILKKKLFCIKMWEIPCVNLYMIDNTKFLRPSYIFKFLSLYSAYSRIHFIFCIYDN